MPSTRRPVFVVAGDETSTTRATREVGVSGTGDSTAAGQSRDAKAVRAAGEQGLLFDADVSVLPEDVGYRGPIACAAAGITYRQLDYWARTGLVEPTVRPAHGSGTQRLYGFRDILVLKIVKRLLDTGVSLQQIRQAVTQLRDRGVRDLAQITLMSDGATVYECRSPDEVVDLLQGGQGVFGIAVGRVWREVEGSLAELPSERPEPEPSSAEMSGLSGSTASGGNGHPADELARRRARRTG
jgi:DNA-binding transcriptional MerR regulator